MRLVACRSCHAQYDAEQVSAERFACRCGAEIENRPAPARDVLAVRCGSCGAALLAEESGESGDPRCSFCGSTVERRPVPGGPVCPECFARTPRGSRFCTACGVAFRPEPLPGHERALACPGCGAPMLCQSVGGLALHQCGRCAGLWVPEGGLEALVESAREARGAGAPTPPRVRGGNPALQRVRYRLCPECGAQMHRRNFRRSSGVIVDVCRPHGTWLDADELEQIAGFLLGRSRDAAFVAGGEPGPPAAAAPEADAAFARILAEHRGLERESEPAAPPSLFELIFGRIR